MLALSKYTLKLKILFLQKKKLKHTSLKVVKSQRAACQKFVFNILEFGSAENLYKLRPLFRALYTSLARGRLEGRHWLSSESRFIGKIRVNCVVRSVGEGVCWLVTREFTLWPSGHVRCSNSRSQS